MSEQPKRRPNGGTSEYSFSITPDMILRAFGQSHVIFRSEAKAALEDAVARQLVEMGIDPEAGPAELPPPPPEEQDTYTVAFAAAARSCSHENATSTSYARHEYQCTDCGRYFTRKPRYW